jgi:hypothetical protein
MIGTESPAAWGDAPTRCLIRRLGFVIEEVAQTTLLYKKSIVVLEILCRQKTGWVH